MLVEDRPAVAPDLRVDGSLADQISPRTFRAEWLRISPQIRPLCCQPRWSPARWLTCLAVGAVRDRGRLAPSRASGPAVVWTVCSVTGWGWVGVPVPAWATVVAAGGAPGTCAAVCGCADVGCDRCAVRLGLISRMPGALRGRRAGARRIPSQPCRRCTPGARRTRCRRYRGGPTRCRRRSGAGTRRP
jgi:hypothetical protein